MDRSTLFLIFFSIIGFQFLNIVFTAGCPVNAKLYKDKCYWIESGPFTYMEARLACHNYGPEGDLVVIDAQEIMDFLKTEILLQSYHRWIGLRDFEPGSNPENIFRNWTWINGKPLESGYINWSSGEPNGFSPDNPDKAAKDCTLTHATDNWRWHDLGCNPSYGGICAMPKVQKEGALRDYSYVRRGINERMNSLVIASQKVSSTPECAILCSSYNYICDYFNVLENTNRERFCEIISIMDFKNVEANNRWSYYEMKSYTKY